MGVPMTRFSMLSNLMRNNYLRNSDEVTEHNAAVRFFQEFRLFAIVLCHPDDSDFIDYMSDNFSMLDASTGKKLLYFSLARPGVTTDAYRMSESPDVAMMDTEEYDVDKDIYLYAMMRALKVDASIFPSILFTNSLTNNTWYVMDTSVQTIYGDLMTLASIANSEGFAVSKIEDKLNSIIRGAGRYWYEVRSQLPLCDILTGIEAAIATNSKDKEKSRKALNTIIKLENSFRSIKGEEVDELFFLFRCIRKVPQSFSIQGQFRNGSRIEPLLISSNGLEDITLGFLSVYEKILTCFAENKLIDYSVLCSLTHKIFESELNASILQLMRLYKKIPMPECYKKWYATKEKYGVLNGTFFINLNDHDKGHPKAYRSPGLGNMYYAFKVMSEDGEWNTLCSKFGLDKEHVNELMSHWENIFRVRNKEAHCTPISFSVYQDITKSVNKVFELCFNNIVMIKKHLR